jgi:L-rhamnose mutarotase
LKHFAFTLNLKNDPQAIGQYKEYHRHVWPEIERMQYRLGVRKIRIFLHGRRLFLYLETEDHYDPAAAAVEYFKDPKIVEWEHLMRANFQEQFAGAKPGEWWTAMEQIYVLDN